MDCNNSFRPSVSQLPESFSGLLYNYNLDPFPEMKQALIAQEAQQVMVGGLEKKKRLSNEQLESLERSFQEEIKLDPDTKMKLSRELGLQPKQVAVWFQNRRARWKVKQLEHLHDALKQDFDTISREKHDLQQEVMRLRTMLSEQTAKNQALMAYTGISSEETAESTSLVASGSSYIYNMEDFNRTSAAPFWGGAQAQLPYYL